MTVTGVDDAEVDGDQDYEVRFAVASTDTGYDAIAVEAVAVTNADDETLALGLDAIAGDDVVNIAEKAAGFAITGTTGSVGGVTVRVAIGSQPALSATSGPMPTMTARRRGRWRFRRTRATSRARALR